MILMIGWSLKNIKQLNEMNYKPVTKHWKTFSVIIVIASAIWIFIRYFNNILGNIFGDKGVLGNLGKTAGSITTGAANASGVVADVVSTIIPNNSSTFDNAVNSFRDSDQNPLCTLNYVSSQMGELDNSFEFYFNELDSAMRFYTNMDKIKNFLDLFDSSTDQIYFFSQLFNQKYNTDIQHILFDSINDGLMHIDLMLWFPMSKEHQNIMYQQIIAFGHD